MHFVGNHLVELARSYPVAAFALLGSQHYSAPTQILLASELLRPILLQHVLSGGDDYELVFTAPAAHRAAVQAAADVGQTPVTRIGQIEAQPGLRLLGAQGQPPDHQFRSFDYFSANA